jgi:hypothetical protein
MLETRALACGKTGALALTCVVHPNKQHYVTPAYLVGFTPEGMGDSQLHVYERNTERMFELIADEAAKRRSYYNAPLLQAASMALRFTCVRSADSFNTSDAELTRRWCGTAVKRRF